MTLNESKFKSSPSPHPSSPAPLPKIGYHYPQVGKCHLCYSETKLTRKSRTACCECGKAVCNPHSMKQSICENCKFQPNLDSSTKKEKNDAPKAKPKGYCSICLNVNKKRRKSRRQCNGCTDYVCDEHSKKKTLCQSCKKIKE